MRAPRPLVLPQIEARGTAASACPPKAPPTHRPAHNIPTISVDTPTHRRGPVSLQLMRRKHSRPEGPSAIVPSARKSYCAEPESANRGLDSSGGVMHRNPWRRAAASILAVALGITTCVTSAAPADPPATPDTARDMDRHFRRTKSKHRRNICAPAMRATRAAVSMARRSALGSSGLTSRT